MEEATGCLVPKTWVLLTWGLMVKKYVFLLQWVLFNALNHIFAFTVDELRSEKQQSHGKYSTTTSLLLLYAFHCTDGWPRSVCWQWRRDASAPRDASAWHASHEPLPGVTCSSASSVPVCSGLLSSLSHTVGHSELVMYDFCFNITYMADAACKWLEESTVIL